MPEPRKILLVDDEPDLRLLVRVTLGTDHFALFEASNGNEALALARSVLPDLVLLDVAMPGLDGYAVCRALKDGPATPGTKVLMLTALVRPADRQQAMLAGADAYIAKPFSPLELIDTVYRLLGEQTNMPPG